MQILPAHPSTRCADCASRRADVVGADLLARCARCALDRLRGGMGSLVDQVMAVAAQPDAARDELVERVA